jgi:predicted transcriptional regulator
MRDIERIGRLLWGEHWQGEMAAALNVHRNTVSDWRRGRMDPREDKVAQLREVAKRRTCEISEAIDLLS